MWTLHLLSNVPSHQTKLSPRNATTDKTTDRTVSYSISFKFQRIESANRVTRLLTNHKSLRPRLWTQSNNSHRSSCRATRSMMQVQKMESSWMVRSMAKTRAQRVATSPSQPMEARRSRREEQQVQVKRSTLPLKSRTNSLVISSAIVKEEWMLMHSGRVSTTASLCNQPIPTSRH